MTADQTPSDAGWTREALDRLLAAVKAEPRVKNEQPKPSKGGDERG